MTKDVFVFISGLQFTEGDENTPIEVIAPGMYYERNGKKYVLYDEVTDGYEGVTKNTIRFSEDSLDIIKKGVTNVHMVFEKQKKNVTFYGTPYGTIQIGIDGKDIRIEEVADKIDIYVDYGLEMNYQFLSNCKIHISVCSKGCETFSLHK